PEISRRIDRKWREIWAVVAIPGRCAPSPTVDHRCGPRIVGPSVVSRMPIVSRSVAVVTAVSAVSVRTVNTGVAHIIDNVRARYIRVAVARDVISLYIAPVSAGGHHFRAVTRTHDGAAAVQAVLDLHTVAVDRPDLSIRTNARRPSALQRNLPAGRRVIHGGVARRRVSGVPRVGATRPVHRVRAS